VARRSTHPIDRAGELADITLESVDGGEVRLGSLWEEGPAVLVFLRHYG
jgi:hypothetical protein